jgi:tyrosyl-tRNA synthetase
MKDFSFLAFIRDIGKHITVNYMMSKDSVKKRLSGEAREGMSFTEFSYQLVQGYDFLYLNQHRNCKLQMGGSDQWGNITTGTELIRRKTGNEAFALTCPLITKADGGKFGKTEKGNIWLDPNYTSPYTFYQFWMSVGDEDAEKYIKIFTMLDRQTIETAIAEHKEAPHMRGLQKLLAKEITIMVHGEEEFNKAVEASNMLFGNSTQEALKKLDEQTFLSVFDGVPQFEVSREKLGTNIIEMLAVETAIFPSKGECRKMIQANGLSINKEKFTSVDGVLGEDNLINDKYILVQKGKKNYFIIKFN